VDGDGRAKETGLMASVRHAEGSGPHR
jgi:hypothetical protein